MVVLYKPLKALSLPSWSLAGFTVVDDMEEGVGEWRLGGTMGGGGVSEQKADRRDR